MKLNFYLILLMMFFSVFTMTAFAGGGSSGRDQAVEMAFPPALDSYHDAHLTNISEILVHRAKANPFNVAATLIFFLAIAHTFVAAKFMGLAHKWEHEHTHLIQEGKKPKDSVHFGAEIMHFFGEIEVIFGLWALALGGAIIIFYDWHTVVEYIGHHVNYTEPMFVVVIMALASTRPILKLSEAIMAQIAKMLGGTLVAWWFVILTFGPLLGSFITEPAAMTICALLLGAKFYELHPSNRLKYATLGLLFVNISVGGTLTHFAAPPVLMVAAPWHWNFEFMLINYGWKAAIGILVANSVYYFIFKKEMAVLQEKYAMIELEKEIQTKFVPRTELEAEFEELKTEMDQRVGFADTFARRCDAIKVAIKARLEERAKGQNIDPTQLEAAFDDQFERVKLQEMRENLPGLLPKDQRPEYFDPDWDQREAPVPAWVTIVHVICLGWTVVNAHYPALFVAGFLFFLGFAQATTPFQNRVDLKPSLLVGFFLGGLVIHGGVQAWWIAPVLGSLTEVPLFLGATILTAFNDNAAITYLSTLVPSFTPELKYAVVAGAVTGGGLTVIANAPNPAGRAILSKYFDDGNVSPIGLVLAALIPTIILGSVFMIIPH